MQVHNYTGECSSFSEPSVFKWLRTCEDTGSESRHQDSKSQTPRKCNSFAWDRAVSALPLRCQAPWWNWSQDLLPSTLLPMGTASGYQGGPAPTESLWTSWQSQHQSLTTVVPQLPAVQKVWSLVGFQLGPRLVQHIQLHFLPIKC